MPCGGKHCKCYVAEYIWQKKWPTPSPTERDGQGLLAIKNSEKFHQKEAHYIWLAHGYLTSLVTEFFVLAALTLPGGARALWWEVASL